MHGFISVSLLGHTAEAVWLPGVETFTVHFRALLMPEMSTVHSVSSSSRMSGFLFWKSCSFSCFFFFVNNVNFNCRPDGLGKHVVKVKTHFWLLSQQSPPMSKRGQGPFEAGRPSRAACLWTARLFSLANEPWTKVSSEWNGQKSKQARWQTASKHHGAENQLSCGSQSLCLKACRCFICEKATPSLDTSTLPWSVVAAPFHFPTTLLECF